MGANVLRQKRAGQEMAKEGLGSVGRTPEVQPFIRADHMFESMKVLLSCPEVRALRDSGKIWFCPQVMSEKLAVLSKNYSDAGEGTGGAWSGTGRWGTRSGPDTSFEGWWYELWREQWNPLGAPYCMLTLGWDQKHYTSMVVCHDGAVADGGNDADDRVFAIASMDSGERFESPTKERLLDLCSLVTAMLFMNNNARMARSAPAGPGNFQDITDEGGIRSIAAAALVQLPCVQQEDNKNNCAFHQQLQLKSVAGVIALGGAWPRCVGAGADLLGPGGLYGGTEHEAQALREGLTQPHLVAPMRTTSYRR